MRIFTIAQAERLKENGSPANRDKDHSPVVRLFMPFTNCVWLLSEIDPEYPNVAFGLCDFGSVDLDEPFSVTNPLGMRIERDASFQGNYPMRVYAAAARACQRS